MTKNKEATGTFVVGYKLIKESSVNRCRRKETTYKNSRFASVTKAITKKMSTVEYDVKN